MRRILVFFRFDKLKEVPVIFAFLGAFSKVFLEEFEFDGDESKESFSFDGLLQSKLGLQVRKEEIHDMPKTSNIMTSHTRYEFNSKWRYGNIERK